MDKIKNFINKNIGDILCIIGLFFIAKTTYKISPIIANYLFGIVCIWLGVALDKILRDK